MPLMVATAMALGQSPERRAILMRTYQHWERLAQEVDAGLIEEMQDRLALYGEEVGLSVGSAAGLSGLVGRVFAQCCQGGDQGDVRGVF